MEELKIKFYHEGRYEALFPEVVERLESQRRMKWRKRLHLELELLSDNGSAFVATWTWGL